MRWQDRIIGVLAIDADSRLRTFDQDDVRLASLFANVAAAAIENAHLYEELQDRATRIQYTLEQKVEARTAELAYRALQLELSAQVSREITSILDVGKLLNRVVTLISEAFGYCYALIFLIDNSPDRLVLKASAGDIDQQFVDQGMDLEILPGSINGEVAQSNKALMINDVTRDRRYKVHKLLPKTRSELAVPLRVGQKVVGTLDVHSDRESAFTQEDVLAIQSLGDQIAIAIENARLYEHSRELAVLEERNRLARELHDSVTQSLYSLTLLAETGRRAAKAQDLERVVHHQVRLGEIAQQALKEMRLLVYELRPSALEEEGLVGSLKQRLDAVEGRAGIETCLIVKGRVELAPRIEVALYRIAQEALNNALKHANATSVTVQVCAGDGSVELMVIDDGCGFDPQGVDHAGGMGLASMRERAEWEKGTLTIRSSPGEGTHVKVELVMATSHNR
jgi:signal transduction histidine kinase